MTPVTSASSVEMRCNNCGATTSAPSTISGGTFATAGWTLVGFSSLPLAATLKTALPTSCPLIPGNASARRKKDDISPTPFLRTCSCALRSTISASRHAETFSLSFNTISNSLVCRECRLHGQAARSSLRCGGNHRRANGIYLARKISRKSSLSFFISCSVGASIINIFATTLSASRTGG